MIERYSRKIFFFLLFVLIFGIFSVEIGDPDFWWHLKTGEYIFHERVLPETDPFSFTSLPNNPLDPDSQRIHFILTQYWLAQVVFYLTHKLLGFQGIIFLRAAILTFVLFITFLCAKREGINPYISAFLLIPGLIIFYIFTGERPQLFSFLFASVLIYLLEGFRKSQLAAGSGIPEGTTVFAKYNNPFIKFIIPILLVMLLWANLHGGFVLGCVILTGYLLAETLKYFSGRFGPSLRSSSFITLCIALIGSILISFLNPNDYKVLPVLMELKQGEYKNIITETMTPFRLFSAGIFKHQVTTFFVLFLAGCFSLLLNLRKLDLTDVTIFSGLAVAGFSAMRFIPFFIPFAILVVARYGNKIINTAKQKGLTRQFTGLCEKFFSDSRNVLFQTIAHTLLSVVLIFVFIQTYPVKITANFGEYPSGAVQFLKENRIPGNMFNPYYWGGYLIWALYPEYKVFIDGRALIEEISFIEENVMEASNQSFAGMPEWKAYLQAYNINFIVTYSVRRYSGQIGPLVPALMQDPDWQLIYRDSNSLIFLRNSPENAEMVRRLGLPKEYIWDEVISEAFLRLGYGSNPTNSYITIGDAFFAKRDYPNAKQAYLKAFETAPSHQGIRQRLDFLNTGGF